jgi:hypothetical protein
MGKLLALLALAVLATPAAHAQNGHDNGAKVGRKGFLLNVKAFDQCPAGDFTDSNRREIAVQAAGAEANKIFLSSGPSFLVQDGNACDQNGAYFSLPFTAANCRNCTGPTLSAPTFREYEVRARVLGKPGGTAKIAGCTEMLVIDPVTQAETPTSLCSIGERNIRVFARDTGGGKAQSQWQNVSAQLLTVCVDTTGDGVCDERIGLFDPIGSDYWWSFDTAGRPHIQLVFLPVEPETSLSLN